MYWLQRLVTVGRLRPARCVNEDGGRFGALPIGSRLGTYEIADGPRLVSGEEQLTAALTSLPEPNKANEWNISLTTVQADNLLRLGAVSSSWADSLTLCERFATVVHYAKGRKARYVSVCWIGGFR